MKITVVGIGYVGVANALVLAKRHHVVCLDVVPDKVAAINNRISPIADPLIDKFFKESDLDISATTNAAEAYSGADFIVVATPTDFDENTAMFDTHLVDTVVEDALIHNREATIVLRSTVPIGHTNKLRKKFEYDNIVFVPEFLREGMALHDCLYPSRLIFGDDSNSSKILAGVFLESTSKQDVPTLFVTNAVAEAIKLFANTYLAMRVAFFNELDSYALTRDLDARALIEGICLDPRIGDHYNNPSFGYGGYCLPKDTRQLLANYSDIPQDLIQATVDSNETRKRLITREIFKRLQSDGFGDNPVVGIFKLSMKASSDNFRSSAIFDVMSLLSDAGVKILIYEPQVSDGSYLGYPVENDLATFKDTVDIIIANRQSRDIADVTNKIFSRDLFQRD